LCQTPFYLISALDTSTATPAAMAAILSKPQLSRAGGFEPAACRRGDRSITPYLVRHQ